MSSKKLHQSQNILRIKVLKWSEYQPAAKSKSWFRMDMDCLRHPYMIDQPLTTKVMWWYILNRCAERNCDVVTLSLRDASMVLGTCLTHVRGALRWWCEVGWVVNLSESLDPKIHLQTDRQTDRQTLEENPTSSSVNSVKDFQDRFLTPSAEETEIWNLLEPMIPKHDHKRWKRLVKKILEHWGNPNDFSKWLEDAFSNNKTFLALETHYAQWKYIARSIENQLTEVGA